MTASDAVTASDAGTGAGTDAGTALSTRRTVWLHVAVFGGFVLLGVLIWWRVWITGHPTTTITCQCGDPSQELWFLTWTPWAIVHGHNPFLTNLIYAGRGGANMMVNTSWMLPSIVLAPVTWLFGPIASFNVAATVAPAISGWCFFVAARRVTTFVPGQVLGGLLFGFSPFVLQNDPFGHLNFTLLFFAPLAFVLVEDLLVAHRYSPVRVGVLFALLVVAELFTSTEFLAMCGVALAIAMATALVLAPRAAWAQRRRVLTAVAVAVAVVVPVAAYPAWMLLAGPRHIVGFPWENSPTLGTTPAAIVRAGIGVHSSSLFDEVGGYFGAIGPNAGPLHLPSLVFLGPVLLAFLAVSALVWYRMRLAWTLVVTTAVVWLFTFGTTLGTEAGPVAQQVHPGWLPWRAMAHLPLVSDILPIRFGSLVMFGAAMLLAISLDRWRTVLVAAADRRRARLSASPGPPGSAGAVETGPPASPGPPGAVPAGARDRWRRPGIAVALTVVGALTLLPIALADPVPFAVVPSALPGWFAVDAHQLPAHTIGLVFPFAGQVSMGWQAQTGMVVALANGFAVVPGPSGRSEFVDPPGGAVAVLDQLSSDTETLAAPPLPSSPADVAEVRAAVIRWDVGVVVVTTVGREPSYSAGFLTAVFGRAPAWQHGAWVWHGRPGTERAPIGGSTLAGCASAQGGPMAVPRCVLAGGSGAVP